MSEALLITETNELRQYWAEQGLGKNHLAQILIADVLIVPKKYVGKSTSYAFHQDTIVLHEFLQQQLQKKAIVELCADDDEYIEILIHSVTHRISGLVVSFVIAPVLVNLLSDYISEQLKAKPTDMVEASITIEDHECRGFKFEFKGEAKDFHLLSDKVGELARNCQANTTRQKNIRRQ